ncbi:MAG: hypothetical protein LBQ98_00125 [Nitrososphaerota archaeon]|jgi:hypothetical protein|nr:hypothetical protein [Nitrososphaerota archaeon]
MVLMAPVAAEDIAVVTREVTTYGELIEALNPPGITDIIIPLSHHVFVFHEFVFIGGGVTLTVQGDFFTLSTIYNEGTIENCWIDNHGVLYNYETITNQDTIDNSGRINNEYLITNLGMINNYEYGIIDVGSTIEGNAAFNVCRVIFILRLISFIC